MFLSENSWIVFAPAAWLTRYVASATDARVLLSDARGSVWSGSAVVVLTGGPGSRDAASLPGRIEWSLRSILANSVMGIWQETHFAPSVPAL